MSMSVELQRALNAIMRKNRESVHELKITVHPEVLQRLRTEDEELLVEMERRYEGRLIFRSRRRLPPREVPRRRRRHRQRVEGLTSFGRSQRDGISWARDCPAAFWGAFPLVKFAKIHRRNYNRDNYRS